MSKGHLLISKSVSIEAGMEAADYHISSSNDEHMSNGGDSTAEKQHSSNNSTGSDHQEDNGDVQAAWSPLDPSKH